MLVKRHKLAFADVNIPLVTDSLQGEGVQKIYDIIAGCEQAAPRQLLHCFLECA